MHVLCNPSSTYNIEYFFISRAFSQPTSFTLYIHNKTRLFRMEIFIFTSVHNQSIIQSYNTNINGLSSRNHANPYPVIYILAHFPVSFEFRSTFLLFGLFFSTLFICIKTINFFVFLILRFMTNCRMISSLVCTFFIRIHC